MPTFMKPCQHSTLPLKLCQHFIHRSCANDHLCHKAIFRGNIAQTSRAYSTVARHQDFRDANKMLKMQGDAKTLTLQRALIKTLKMQGNAKTLKFQEECRQDFDIAKSSH